MAPLAVQSNEARPDGRTPDPRNEAPNSSRDTSNLTVHLNEKTAAQHITPTVSHGETLPGWTIMRPLKMRTRTRHSAGSQDGIPNGQKKGGDDLKITETNDTSGSRAIGEVESAGDLRSDDELLDEDEHGDSSRRRQLQNHFRGGRRDAQRGSESGLDGTANVGEFKVYKRRWFGLIQLVLLNIIVSWDVSSPHLKSSLIPMLILP